MFLLIQSLSLHSQHAGIVLECMGGQHELRICCVTILYLSSKELLSEKCIWLPFPAEFCLFEMFKKSIDLTSNRLGFAGCVKAQTSFCVTPKSGLHKHPVLFILQQRTSYWPWLLHAEPSVRLGRQ